MYCIIYAGSYGLKLVYFSIIVGSFVLSCDRCGNWCRTNDGLQETVPSALCQWVTAVEKLGRSDWEIQIIFLVRNNILYWLRGHITSVSALSYFSQIITDHVPVWNLLVKSRYKTWFISRPYQNMLQCPLDPENLTHTAQFFYYYY